ncbi:hypothetical protein PENSPDRAFT_695061 [Peniophora sp. CONT]|nr:hypothetical protein PENSPDRAFT_695061 [Peniophora sp. CONT]
MENAQDDADSGYGSSRASSMPSLEAVSDSSSGGASFSDVSHSSSDHEMLSEGAPDVHSDDELPASLGYRQIWDGISSSVLNALDARLEETWSTITGARGGSWFIQDSLQSESVTFAQMRWCAMLHVALAPPYVADGTRVLGVYAAMLAIRIAVAWSRWIRRQRGSRWYMIIGKRQSGLVIDQRWLDCFRLRGPALVYALHEWLAGTAAVRAEIYQARLLVVQHPLYACINLFRQPGDLSTVW